MAELKSSTVTNGEPSAMTVGTSMTLTLFADSLVSQGWLPIPLLWPITAKELALFGWMMWRVQATSHISTIADSLDGAYIIVFTWKIPALFVDTAHLTLGWQMVVSFMDVLKFTTMEHGAQCATISGISMMPTWCVASLDSPAQPTSTTMHIMAKARGEFGWMT